MLDKGPLSQVESQQELASSLRVMHRFDPKLDRIRHTRTPGVRLLAGIPPILALLIGATLARGITGEAMEDPDQLVLSLGNRRNA
jgi:hypothetical protein